MLLSYAENGSVLIWWRPFAPQQSIYLDSHTNPTLASAISADPTAYLVVDGVLTRDGQPVPINPLCDDCQTLALVDGGDPLTGDQVKSILKLMIEKPGFTRG